MLEVLPKLVFVVLLMMADGDLKSNSMVVDECPPPETVIPSLEGMLERKEIKGWFAVCIQVPFKVIPYQPL